MTISNPIPIVDGSYNSSYFKVDGGVNSLDSTVTGYVPTTNKSIKLNITNIDTDYKYYQIAAMHIISGTGQASTVYTDSNVSITGTTDSYTYTGNIDNLSTIALSDVTVDNQVIEVAKAHAQLDNRLFIANTTSKEYDWASIQRAANLITVKWVSHQVASQDINSGGKGGKYYIDTRSWMRDEIYALGIEGMFGNTNSTPAFHIPGRDTISTTETAAVAETYRTNGNSIEHYRNQVDAGLDWDKQLLSVVATATLNTEVELEDVRHLGFTATTDDIGDGAGVVERWKVYNTATTVDVNDSANVIRSGKMSYYECTGLYPDTKDCDGNFIYPNDGAANTVIRHHKFPDTTYVNHVEMPVGDVTNASIVPMGLELDLTAFLAALPAEVTADILEWRIVKALRTGTNKTVLDKGYTSNSLEWDSVSSPTAITGKYSDIAYYDSPAIYLRGTFLGGSHIKYERTVMGATIARQNYDIPSPNSKHDLAPQYHSWIVYANGTTQTFDQGFGNREIKSSTFVDPASLFLASGDNGIPGIYDTQNGKNIFNSMYNKRRYSIGIEGAFNALPADFLILPYSIAGSLGVIPANFDARGACYYISVKEYNNNAYNDINNLIYYPTTGCAYTSGETIFGGDIFITRFTTDERYTQTFDGTNSNFPTYAERDTGCTLVDAWYESEVNAELRHDDDTKQEYFKSVIPSSDSFSGNPQQDAIFNYFDIPELKIPEEGGPADTEILSFYGYNEDYSAQNELKASFPLSGIFNYCSGCITAAPYRIHYSEKATQEGITDHYKSFLSNNYADIIGSTGSINLVTVERDQLYAMTDKAVYFIPTRPQQLTTGESSIYIGTGEVLSIPAKRLVSPNFAYGGCKHPFSLASTEYGTIYVDEQLGSIFHLTDKLEEISTKGHKQWFKNNLPLSLLKQYKEQTNGDDYPINSTVSNNGVGYSATYDPRYKRYILHKRDYEIIDPVLTTYDTTLDIWYYNGTALSGFDPRYFVNKSWTISFSLQHQAWASYHSYFPRFAFNDENVFYTTKLDGVYSHDGPYQNYYGTKYDHTVDFIINPDPGQTKTFSSLSVISDVSLYDTTTKQFLDIPQSFFDNGIFYNSYQSTGKKSITMLESNPFLVVDNQTNIYAHKIDQSVHINSIRNFITDYTLPIWTSDWTTIQPDYYIDKVPNASALDVTKSLFEYERLKDEWFGARLFFNPTEDYKITTDIVATTTSQSFR